MEVHANTDDLAIQNAKLNFPLATNWHLRALGPKSTTCKRCGPEVPDNGPSRSRCGVG